MISEGFGPPLGHLDGALAGRFGDPHAVGMDRRRRRRARQRHAHRLHHAGHGAGRAHHAAGADRSARAVRSATSISSALMRPPRNSPHRRRQSVQAPSTSPLKWPTSIGPTGSTMVGRSALDRRHHLRRRGLVAAADQHHRIHRQRADHLLGVHRHQIAQEHRGRIGEALVDRDGREHHRHGAGQHRRRASPPRSVAARCRGRD